MTDLLIYIAVTIVGYFVGAKLKKQNKTWKWVGPMQTLVIIVLVFLMGSRIGASEEIISSLGTIGLVSFVFTLIIIVVFVAVGIAAGYLFLPDGFIAATGTLLTITLCVLPVLVGIDIGTEGTLGTNFRSAGWRVVVFPFVSLAAMILGCLIAALILPLGMQDSLCIGSGLGWYSLAAAMLVEYSPQISAICFMHCVIREVIGILLIPICAKKLGYIESYCLPGASSMDVCMPIVEKATNGTVAVYSFVNGVVLSASVPILVSIFMSIF